jgi:shikimate dehydrogenase
MQSPIILGNSKLVGLLGDPVEHSISPIIHNHAFSEMGLPYVYVPLRVKATDLHVALAALRTFSFVGANVTVPHKLKITPYCDALSPLSEVVGAVNTLYFSNGLLHGATTDAEGFFRALAWMGHDPSGGRTVVLGNGGVARTLAFALAMEKAPKRITFIGRDLVKVRGLASDITKKTGCSVEGLVFNDPQSAGRCLNCSLLVNCTSVGMHPDAQSSPIEAAWLNAGTTVFDTVYNPATTKLLADARRAGCPAQNGLRMLLYQGLASLKLWTGLEAPETLFDIEELTRQIGGPTAPREHAQ